MKRHAYEVDEDKEEMKRAEETAKCLLLFSHAFAAANSSGAIGAAALPLVAQQQLRDYECKTCNRRFPSFQALGGHRASHKRLRFADEEGDDEQAQKQKGKPRGHECAICGLEFSIGQALGGHMRRHRNAHELVLHAQTSKKADDHGKKVPLLDLNLPPVDDFSACACG
ncbi:zinc finger protein ZAT12-like [Nymphaea colorata]|uniref:C2H2-type domain-containing protein n=1 Tax=Nymphaea colorata TaxID=210225 RepID=A0A5K1D7C8_9MAGN|nr:zinc finger protein ZAT12-like [Nymphaea colorata]